jgi:deazaflavin-dependent oxidoreductase (nitroreductase family)
VKGKNMSTHSTLPGWLKFANRLIVGLNRLGGSFGTWHILSIRGRKSGKMRSTPVSVLHVNGQRYVVTGFDTQWVKNARKDGRGMLARGRKQEEVVLVEISVEERAPILREFPRQVPHGMPFFERILGIPADPEALVAAASRCPVFRLDPVPKAERPEVGASRDVR